MTAPRFFIAPGEALLQSNTDLVLPDAPARHAVQALRLRDGAAIVLFDGRGGEYPATLAVSGGDVHARVGAHVGVERESRAPVTLVQALVAGDVMDDIVRKAVELGAAAIVPVLAERSQRVPAERLGKRVARWRQIAIAACEQCGRNRVPDVASVTDLRAWLRAHETVGDCVVLDPQAPASLAAVAGQHRISALIVGPEGGLTRDEARLAHAGGAVAAHVGSAILRADTAAIAALAIVGAQSPAEGGDRTATGAAAYPRQ